MEFVMTEMNKAYYKCLREKVKKFDYTIMSVVSEKSESEEHAAYCYTIGLSNFGYPEIMFADCFYEDVIEVTDLVLEQIKTGKPISSGKVFQVSGGCFKVIELLEGIKEETTEQAKKYFKYFRPEQPEYNLFYLGKSDELGLFPDEKVFEESKHIKQLFYKLQKASCLSSIVSPAPNTVQ